MLGLCTFVIVAYFSGCKSNAGKSAQTKAIFSAVIDSANRLYDNGEQAHALAYLDSFSINYNELDFAQKVSFNTLHYNYYLHIKRDNKKALHYADIMLKLSATAANEEDRNEVYGKAKFYKGDALFREQRYNEAYLNYYQGKLAANKTNKLHDCMLSDYSYHMGMILYKQEHYRLAAQYFKTSFNETLTCEMTFRSFYRRQELLNNAGLSYNKIDDQDSALLYFDKALAYINHTPKNYLVADKLLAAARGVIYGNQASVYLKSQQLSKAKILLKKSIAINTKEGFDNNDALLSRLKLARVYEKQNQIDSMLMVLGEANVQLAKTRNEEAAADWHNLMAAYYEHTEQLAKAIGQLKIYNEAQTAVFNKTLTLKATDVTEQLKRFERDYEVNELKRTNEQKSNYLKLAIVFFVMAVIIILLVYLNWRKSKKLLSTMSELNQEIHNKNEDLQKALVKLEQSHQDKDRILRTVAHDLRNPIGGIASLIGSAIEDEDCTVEQMEYLQLVKTTAYNSLELINEILEATNSHVDTLEKEWVDINDLLNNSVELLRFKAAEKNQQILLEVLAEPQEVLISREKIWRVTSNLISNAIKFSPVGGSISVKVIKIDDDIEVSVNDHGIGIPDEMKESVFNMFTEAKRPGTLGEKSFGLGLSICRHIIEMHNGQIWFESHPQHGTTFYFRLLKVTRPAKSVTA